MESIYRTLNSNYLRCYRYAFQTHPRGHSIFRDLDDLICQKDNFIEYIKFEYSLSIFYNLVVAIPSLIYSFSRFSNIIQCDLIATLWILTVSALKLAEIIPKTILIYQTVRISKSSTDHVLCSRRLMYMTRSNVFFYNTSLGFALLLSYTVYFLLFRRTNFCNSVPQFGEIINLLIFGFILRLIISFVNYFLHFKFGVNEADVHNAVDLYENYQNKVPQDVLEMIDSVTLSVDNLDEFIPFNKCDEERDVCCICMLDFRVEETIKLMPCNKKHIFHKVCIYKWLSNNKNCPTCRKEISKKLIMKNKIY